jgi:hypothetical protein
MPRLSGGEAVRLEPHIRRNANYACWPDEAQGRLSAQRLSRDKKRWQAKPGKTAVEAYKQAENSPDVCRGRSLN